MVITGETHCFNDFLYILQSSYFRKIFILAKTFEIEAILSFKPKKIVGGNTIIKSNVNTAWKLSKDRVISGRYFPVFSTNAGKYGPKLTLYLDTFPAVWEIDKRK